MPAPATPADEPRRVALVTRLDEIRTAARAGERLLLGSHGLRGDAHGLEQRERRGGGEPNAFERVEPECVAAHAEVDDDLAVASNAPPDARQITRNVAFGQLYQYTCPNVRRAARST
jgi:hypothetical protein